MTLTMNDVNPPTFKLAGSGRLIFFLVYEPVPGKPLLDDPVMWEIRPTEENLISILPPITYGVVPPGFRQLTHREDQAPPLVEGKVYQAGGPAFDANGGSIRFTIKDGRPIELKGEQENKCKSNPLLDVALVSWKEYATNSLRYILKRTGTNACPFIFVYLTLSS